MSRSSTDSVLLLAIVVFAMIALAAGKVATETQGKK
jgi:hypothetical protein